MGYTISMDKFTNLLEHLAGKNLPAGRAHAPKRSQSIDREFAAYVKAQEIKARVINKEVFDRIRSSAEK